MKISTLLTRLGRPQTRPGVVNPPIERGSTVLTDRGAGLYDAPPESPLYGTAGLATHKALANALCELTGAHHCALAPTGLSAMTLPILTQVSTGGHVLACDNIYGPVRRFLGEAVSRWGVEVEFYEPRIGRDIAGKLRPNTQLVICESPGSLTFEVQDIPAIAAAAHACGAKVMADDTWSAGLTCNMLDLGVDYAAQALTKYIGGHADILLGAVLARDEDARKLRRTADIHGLFAAAEDCWLALRGLRTAAMRMERSAQTAMTLTDRLAQHPATTTLLYPPRHDHPDHAIYQRDFTGAAGLFGVVFEDWDNATAERFLDALKIFGLGFSWGGYESLAIHCDPQIRRSHGTAHRGTIIRLAIGLEDVDDLWLDLEQAIAAATD